MTKTSKTSKTTTKATTEKKVGRKAAEPKVAMKIAEWVHTVARARGTVADAIHHLKADKTFRPTTSDKAAADRLSALGDAGATLLARHKAYCQRGSQAGKRSRAKAA